MIDRGKLLSDLQAVLRKLEADLLERSDSREVAEVGQTLRDEYQKAQKANRTAQSYEEWRSDYITQIAAAWVLSCVFARFLEDNRLVDPPRLSGSAERLARARDEHELYFRAHPTQTDREYLLHIFGELRKLPGAKEIFGEHNPIHDLPNSLSGDAAGELLKFFQRIDANTGALVHDFTDPSWDTRFLGDLYQDLSEAARKKYALLQTPIFVEEFILDRTLDPAIEEFGLEGFRMIDPASGSGHFLLGSFHRILQRWLKKEPGTNVRVLVQRVLDSIHGVDVNSYAVAIARFRLLLAAIQTCGLGRLADSPAFHINLVCGDSLLHGAPGGDQLRFGFRAIDHVYNTEDRDELRRILRPDSFHSVVANPPYIGAKDPLANQAYRERFRACHGRYQLVVPFLERFFQLAIRGGATSHAGRIGAILSNAFMKASFGLTLVEEYMPKWDLTHVVDTSGAYIPGHGNPEGTPTVILFARNQQPVTSQVRVVMGIKSEPGVPEELARGKVWSAILDQIDRRDSESEFISVADLDRELLHKHPWSIGGGGITVLKETIESAADCRLQDLVEEIGFFAITGEDDVFSADLSSMRRRGIKPQVVRPFVTGTNVRDWQVSPSEVCIFPYNAYGDPYFDKSADHYLWQYRTCLVNTMYFGKLKHERGLNWREYAIFLKNKYRTRRSIVFAFTATHNHFALDSGGRVFKQTAPVIKMSAESTEADHLALIGMLNSSTACFWMRQVCFPRGGYSGGKWEERFNFNNNSLQPMPIPVKLGTQAADWLCRIAARMCELCTEYVPFVPAISESNEREEYFLESRQQAITFQEELDWRCYHIYALIREDLTYSQPPSIRLGQRAFEIVMARKMVAGELETTWFERHGSKPITEIPAEWPDDYKRLVERRIEIIESDRNIGLIEQPEYKRRWTTEPWESQQERALRIWLLDRLESYYDFDGRMNDQNEPTAKLGIALASTIRLTDIARQDIDFMKVGEHYRDDPGFDVQELVDELVEDECVTLLPVLCYKDSGLRKRVEWEDTWDLQRQEDTIDARSKLPKDNPNYLSDFDAKELKRRDVGDIPAPAEYQNKDFQKSTYWRLRGKLDVPKERWVSFPYCEGEDGQMVIAWAGYDQLQLAKAISAYYVDIQERLGGREDPRLPPLLASKPGNTIRRVWSALASACSIIGMARPTSSVSLFQSPAFGIASV
jgi:hypothetical protein